MRLLILLFSTLLCLPSYGTEDIKFRDLYGKGGSFSEKAEALNGETIRVRGYMAPPLKAQATFYVLTKMPMSVCPFCEQETEWPTDIMLVRTDEVIDVVPFTQPIYVTGTLDIGTKVDEETGFLSRVRLLNAEYDIPR